MLSTQSRAAIVTDKDSISKLLHAFKQLGNRWMQQHNTAHHVSVVCDELPRWWPTVLHISAGM